MFSECDILRSLELGSFKGDKIIDMSKMFYNCRGLPEFKLNLDCPKVETMESIFDGCKQLSTITMPKFSSGSLKSLKRAFANCKELTSISINLDTSNMAEVTDMSQMFYGNRLLKTVTITGDNSKMNGIGFTAENMEGIFEDCQSLETINYWGNENTFYFYKKDRKINSYLHYVFYIVELCTHCNL